MTRDELEHELARLHGESFGWAMACCGRDRDLAADALQSAYLRVVSGQARFGGRSRFKTWFFGVVRMTALEEMRRVRRLHESTVDVADAALIASPDPGPDALPAEDVAKALASLPDRQRETAQLVFYHGLTVAEAAAVMGVSLGSARTHYDRAKRALANALAALGPERER